MIENDKQYSTLKRSQFLEQVDEPNKLAIKMEPQSFKPNSQVKVEIQSEPIKLGEFITDEDGGLTVELNLPKKMDYGYHTVSLLGTSYSGESIELYQAVSHTDTESNKLINEIDGRNDNIASLLIKTPESKKPERQIIKDNIAKYANNPKSVVLGDETDNTSSDNTPKLKNTFTIIGIVFLIISISIFFLFKNNRKTRPKNPDGPI